MATNHKDSHVFEAGLTASALIDGTAAGVATQVAVDDVHDTTPTEAQIITAFGTAASNGAGFIGLINDNDAEAISYIVWSTGTKYFWIAGALAA